MSYRFANFCCVGHWALVPLTLNYSIAGHCWCLLGLTLVLIDTLDREVELWVFLFDRFTFIRTTDEGILRWCDKHGSSASLSDFCHRWLIASHTAAIADLKVTFFQLLCLLCHLTLDCSETIIIVLSRAALIDAGVSFFSMAALLETCQRSIITIRSAVANVDCVRIRNTQLTNLVKLGFGCGQLIR